MATRQYKKPSVVSGLTISDIMQMSESKFKSYSISDQRKIVSRLVSAGNKRVRTFERAGKTSPAILELMESGGKLSTRGKTTTGELIKEMTRARVFLRQKISTLREWRKVEKKVKEGFEKKGVNLEPEQVSDIMSIMDKVFEYMGYSTAAKYRIASKAQVMLNQMKSPDEIVEYLTNNLEEIYKETQQDYAENIDFSDFTDIE